MGGKGLRLRAHGSENTEHRSLTITQGPCITQAGRLRAGTAQPVPGGRGLCRCCRGWELAGETESFSETFARLALDPGHQPNGAMGHLTELGDSAPGKWPEERRAQGRVSFSAGQPQPETVPPAPSSAPPPDVDPLTSPLSDLCLLLRSGQTKSGGRGDTPFPLPPG